MPPDPSAKPPPSSQSVIVTGTPIYDQVFNIRAAPDTKAPEAKIPDTASLFYSCVRSGCCLVACCFWAPIQKVVTGCDTVQNCYQLNNHDPKYPRLMQKDLEWGTPVKRAAAGEVAVCAPLSSMGSICSAACGCICCKVPQPTLKTMMRR